MANYIDNGYDNFLSIDTLTAKLGTFGNETINSSNIDSFIEDDVLPEGGLPVVDTGYNVNILNGHIELRDGITPLAYFGLTADGSSPPDMSVIDGTLSVAALNTGQINGPQTQAFALYNGYGSSLFNFMGGGFISVYNILGLYNGNFLLSTYGDTAITYNTGYEDVGVNYSSTKSLLVAGYSLSPVPGINMGLGGGNIVTQTWQSVSIDGTNIVAAVASGRLYYYNGSIWSEVQPAGDADYNWYSVSISGTNMVAGILNGRLYYYDGATWTEQQPAGNVDKQWASVSISGTNMVAAVFGGRLYYYDGATWSEVQPAGNADKQWTTVSIDGTKIIAAVSNGRLYYYNGSSWAEQQPAGNSNKNWKSVSISGTNMVAAVFGGRFYYNFGSGWNQDIPAGNADKNWNSVSVSGNNIVAGIYNGRLYYWNGSVWAQQLPESYTNRIYYVSISGTNMVAAGYNDNLYYYDGAAWTKQNVVGGDDYWNWLLLKPNVNPPSYINCASFTYYKSGVTTQFRGVMEKTGTIYSFDLTAV